MSSHVQKLWCSSVRSFAFGSGLVRPRRWIVPGLSHSFLSKHCQSTAKIIGSEVPHDQAAPRHIPGTTLVRSTHDQHARRLFEILTVGRGGALAWDLGQDGVKNSILQDPSLVRGQPIYM